MIPPRERRSPLSIHIAWPGSRVYRAGRRRAAAVYRSVWQTRSLSDDHALGVVVFAGRRAIGNVNLHVSRQDRELPSEGYFEANHWQSYYPVTRAQIGEVAALAIDSELAFEPRELSLLGLMYGLCIGSRMLGLRLLSTVEHQPLARRMKGYLGLPLVHNERVVTPGSRVPDDGYWSGEHPPQLYYMDLLDPELARAGGNVQAYLASKGVPLRIAHGEDGEAPHFYGFVERLERRRQAAVLCKSPVRAA